ncbi:MAG: 23S rRNA (pseudouridine(1915)-N(3))-methyltransferase RlmH [Bacilli bacterium]
MLKIKLITVGTIKEPYLKAGIQEFEKRLERFVQLTTIEIPESISKQDHSDSVIKALEIDAKLIKQAIPSQSYVIALDIQGKTFKSQELAKQIDSIQQKNSHIVFIIGGSNGLDDSIRNLAKEMWSFSPLTFPHQLFRLIFLEQIYRSMTILKGHPYHK